MDFNGSFGIIRELFKNYEVTDGFGNTSVFRKSYIYVISKVIDRKKYYKVGMSTKSDISRMRDANTYLIPGQENHGYKVHYLFFYEESPYPRAYAHYVEAEIHKILRHEFESYSISFLNDNPSEWYLPTKPGTNKRSTRRTQSGEDWFFGYITGLVAVNFPKPRESYQFTPKSRKTITKNIVNPSKAVLRQYIQHKRDWREILKEIKIKKKTTKAERDALIGNSDFWNEHLVGLEFRDEKKNWVITKVEWRPGIGLNTYVALYVIKGRGSDIDKKGHETQLVELFDPKSFPYFTKRRVTRLGLYDKYLELQKRRAEGSN